MHQDLNLERKVEPPKWGIALDSWWMNSPGPSNAQFGTNEVNRAVGSEMELEPGRWPGTGVRKPNTW